MRKKIEQLTKIEVDGVLVDAKACGKCKAEKPISCFSKNKNRAFGLQWSCKDCCREERRNHYVNNKEAHYENTRAYRERNRERAREYSRRAFKKFLENNPEYNRLKSSKRRAKERLLPADLTIKQANKIREHFGNTCALTGEKDGLHLDHFIALATGHGGTTLANMIPLSSFMNTSKRADNPFEWIKREDIAAQIDPNKWTQLVEYLADLNGMTTQEYEDYVYYCYENKKEVAAAI
jgi:hypothetical protein